MNYDLPKSLLDNLTTAVLLLDEHLRVRYLNPAAEQLLAASRSQLLNTHIRQLINESDPNAHADMESALTELHPFTKREAQLYVANNSQPATVDYTVTPLLEPGYPRSLLMEIRPLDRLMRISKEDGLMNAHQATRALVRGVAHEVKNPLGGIRGAAQLLARELPDEALHEYTDIIIDEVDRLRNLVDRMLGPRKLPKLAPTNIHEILERVRAVMLAEAGDELLMDRDYDPSLPELWGDKDQLIQAILNVVRNARQALAENPDQQDPKLVMRTRALRQFTIGHVRHRLILLVEIEDNGPGVEKELQETMFYPMVSGRASGTGLGLSISQSIVNQHHGLIECDSQPGKTIFRLLLPLEKPEAPLNVGV
jgi:two-component system nitrogen regulation sensor histidine kinase GlnL